MSKKEGRGVGAVHLGLSVAVKRPISTFQWVNESYWFIIANFSQRCFEFLSEVFEILPYSCKILDL